MTKIVYASDLGGTNLRFAAVNASGEILFRTKRETPRRQDGSGIVDAIVDAAKECSEEMECALPEMVALAVPAVVNSNSGVILRAPNLPELNGFHISDALSSTLGIQVILENDANAAAIGEKWLGASRGFESSIMVTLGTGVGGGIIIDGKVLRGIDGTAGEIGHICVEPDGLQCGCGSHGCVEQYASATAVLRMAVEFANESNTDEFTSDQFETSKDIYELAKKGDRHALEAFRRQGFYLGILFGGLINALNPEAIVIGGGAAAGWDLFMPQLVEQIGVRAYRKPRERVKLVRAELGDDAGIIGAAWLGFQSKQ